jgi:hypothetical protein
MAAVEGLPRDRVWGLLDDAAYAPGAGGIAPPDRPRELAAFARAGFSRRIAGAVLACADEEAIGALARDGLG